MSDAGRCSVRVPRRLWSLSDMLELKASSFYHASNSLQHLHTAVDNRKDQARNAGRDDGVEPISDPVFMRIIMAHLDTLQDASAILGANLTSMEIDRFRAILAKGWVTLDSIVLFCSNIRSRLTDELSMTKVFVIEPGMRELVEPTNPMFGEDFQSKFSKDGAFELDEAAKYLALGRPTASVFHLMRLMEVGIRAVARCLQIPDPVKPADRNWGKILNAIKNDGINVRWPATANRMSGDGAFFESIYASLDAVRNPWRNATMHIENKYTEDEAHHIFLAVKGFMKKLASRCDEHGQPLAPLLDPPSGDSPT